MIACASTAAFQALSQVGISTSNIPTYTHFHFHLLLPPVYNNHPLI